MNIAEALQKSTKREARREDFSDLTTARFFKGTGGKRLQVEMCAVGMERDLTLEEWLADDWSPVAPEPLIENIVSLTINGKTYKLVEQEGDE